MCARLQFIGVVVYGELSATVLAPPSSDLLLRLLSVSRMFNLTPHRARCCQYHPHHRRQQAQRRPSTRKISLKNLTHLGQLCRRVQPWKLFRRVHSKRSPITLRLHPDFRVRWTAPGLRIKVEYAIPQDEMSLGFHSEILRVPGRSPVRTYEIQEARRVSKIGSPCDWGKKDDVSFGISQPSILDERLNVTKACPPRQTHYATPEVPTVTKPSRSCRPQATVNQAGVSLRERRSHKVARAEKRDF